MLEVKSHIKALKHILLVWLVLFSLAPCSVKEVFNGVLYSSQKPLNKTKTALIEAGCEISPRAYREKSVSQSEAGRTVIPMLFFGAKKAESRPAVFFEGFSGIYSGNSPPKYILYKRLKVDAA